MMERSKPSEKQASISMNRRHFIAGAASFAIGAKLQHDTSTTPTIDAGPQSSPKQLSFPSAVAGVRLVDSKIARDATQLGREAYPPYLFNHAVRTFLFGSLIGKKLRQRTPQLPLGQMQGPPKLRFKPSLQYEPHRSSHRYDRRRAGRRWEKHD